MGSEYFINSQELENKVRDLLPSQGGAGAGFDLSASTQIIPIIDLTESAEGSNVRADLQTALSFASCTTFNVNNATTTLITTTGYFRVFGVCDLLGSTSATRSGEFNLSDGATNKQITQYRFQANSSGKENAIVPYDFIIFLPAGDSLSATASTEVFLRGVTRQIATIDGTLVNPN